MPEEALMYLKKIKKKHVDYIKNFYNGNKSYVDYLNIITSEIKK